MSFSACTWPRLVTIVGILTAMPCESAREEVIQITILDTIALLGW